jgi:hypothetical protein
LVRLEIARDLRFEPHHFERALRQVRHRDRRSFSASVGAAPAPRACGTDFSDVINSCARRSSASALRVVIVRSFDALLRADRQRRPRAAIVLGVAAAIEIGLARMSAFVGLVVRLGVTSATSSAGPWSLGLRARTT